TLKFPIGCARPSDGTRSRPSVPRTRRPLLVIPEEPLREVSVEHVEVWVRGEGAPEVRLARGDLPQTEMDHARMEEEPGILRSELQGFADRHSGLGQLTVLIESPREHVVRINVTPDLQLLAGQLERADELAVVIGVEVRQLTVVEDLIERVQASDVFDKGVFPSGSVGVSHRDIEVAEGGGVIGERNDRERLLIKVNGLRVTLLGCPHLRQSGEGAMVVRIARKAVEVSRLGRLQAAEGEVLGPELPLRPRDTLARSPVRLAVLDGARQYRNRPRGIATDRFQPGEAAPRVEIRFALDHPPVGRLSLLVVTDLELGVSEDA